jgi:segregation and condensation protein B
MASLAEKRIEQIDEQVEEPAMEQPAARPEELRLLEALLFASSEPLDQAALAKRMPEGVDIKEALAQLQADYASRGVNLVRVANKWTFRTAGDLSWLMTRESTETRRLSRAAIEVLAIIAYHQPVTRAEIEEIRGVITSKGTLDVLLETGWIRPRGRRKTPGRPLTFGTTEAFLSQFSLEALGDLPGLEELKGTGLLDSRLPGGFSVPTPSDDPALREDEDPLEAGDLELALAPAVEPEKDGGNEHEWQRTSGRCHGLTVAAMRRVIRLSASLKSLFLPPPAPSLRTTSGRVSGRVFGGLQDGFTQHLALDRGDRGCPAAVRSRQDFRPDGRRRAGHQGLQEGHAGR